MKSASITKLYNVEGGDMAPGELLPQRGMLLTVYLFFHMRLSTKKQKKKGMKSASITKLYNVEGGDTAPGELLSQRKTLLTICFTFNEVDFNGEK